MRDVYNMQDCAKDDTTKKKSNRSFLSSYASAAIFKVLSYGAVMFANMTALYKSTLFGFKKKCSREAVEL